MPTDIKKSHINKNQWARFDGKLPLMVALLIFVAVSCVITFFLGKDTNWDLLNYHLYSPHAFWTQDLRGDFMGASAQRYLNPIGYLPFYWMFQAGWHSLIIGMMLAAFHSLALFFLWMILSRHVFAGVANGSLWSAISMLMAATSPVFLGVIGGTFLDPTTNVFFFAGLLLLFAYFREGQTATTPVFWAGVLFGVAAGLKLTNVIFGVSAALALLIVIGLNRAGVAAFVRVTIGAICGGLISSGFWFWRLFNEFGNPVFPLFNHLFKSPDFPVTVLAHRRFIADGFLEAVSQPFRMADFHSWIYVEHNAPDLRFAVIAVLLLLFVLIVIRRTTAATPVQTSGAVGTELSGASRFLLAVFFLSYVFWQSTSGNGRYALPVLLLAGPVLVILIRRVIGNRRFAVIMCLVIAVVHVFHFSAAGNPRWSNGPWTNKWLTIDVPKALVEKPYGYLTIGVITNSAVALRLHPDSRLLNLVGTYPLDPHGAGSKRVNAFMAEHDGRLRVIFETVAGTFRDGNLGKSIRGIDQQISGWDIRIVAEDCLPIYMPDLLTNGVELIACRLQKGNPLRVELDRERAKMTALFDQIEKTCPSLFSPGGVYVIKKNGLWLREYVNSDIRMFATQGRMRFSRYEFGPLDVDLGAIDDWAAGRGRFICTRLPRPF